MIFYSRLRNLDHIETAPNLKWVQLEELKRLEDISALEHIAESVEALCISGCPKVKDFSVLEKLVNLRHLELTGRNEISSLSFLNQMPQIQTFLFSVNVLDGDLTPCMKIPYVYCERNRKHYNLKIKICQEQWMNIMDGDISSSYHRNICCINLRRLCLMKVNKE